MADNQATATEWYLAREGQQFGPITVAEMRKLIELGHLKDTDLVWRPGLAEWQPSTFAINELEELRLREAQAAAAAQAQTSAASPAGPRAVDRQSPASQNGRPTGSSGHGAAAGASRDQRSAYDQRGFSQPAQSVQGPVASEAAPHGQQHGAYRPGFDDMRAGAYGPTDYAAGNRRPGPANAAPQGPQQQPQAAQAYHEPNQGFGAPERMRGSGPQPRSGQLAKSQRPARSGSDHFDGDDDAPRGSVLGVIVRAVIAVAILSAIGFGGWFAYLNKDVILEMAGLSAEGGSAPLISAQDGVQTLAPSSGAPPETGSNAPPIPLFETPLWKTADDAFPLWTTQSKEEALELQRNGTSTEEIERRLLAGLAGLRRQYWQNALAAEPNTLRTIANTFLDNLKALREKDIEACYSFIRQGEASPKVLEMMNDQTLGGSLRQQLQVILEAIVSGRRDPNTHSPPLQKDYRLISEELSKLGWTTNEMSLFGDPKKLAQAEPEQVCKLVTDWFTAQLQLTDPEAQTRLLVQSLRPVVSG